ncbi:MAG TPA: hypothetical protein VGA13_04140 [Acidimicrobiales bacterium]
MLIACWSAKGGVGVTVVVAALAQRLATASLSGPAPTAPPPVLAVDLAGDLPAVLGVADHTGPGVADWLAAAPDAPSDAIDRLSVDLGGGLALLPTGAGPLPAGGGEHLAAALASSGRAVVVDCGSSPTGAALAVASAARRSVLVVRLCYLAIRRGFEFPLDPSEVIVVEEPMRALTCADVERVLGAPVTARIPLHPAVGRAVDAGSLLRRMPHSLSHSLRSAA